MNYTEYLALYNATKATRKETISFEKWQKIRADFRERERNAKTPADALTLHNEYLKIAKSDSDNEMFNKGVDAVLCAMSNNLDYLFFTEKMPAILAVLQGYNGKKYGDKTREKIHNELKEKINCHVWFDGYNTLTRCHVCELINGYTNGGRTIEISVNNHDTPFINENNVINGGLTLDDLRITDNRGFIENPPEYVAKLKALKTAISETAETLRGQISEYNQMCVKRFKHVDYIGSINADLFH